MARIPRTNEVNHAPAKAPRSIAAAVLIALTGHTLAISAALAQSPPDEAITLDQITVTARQRSERLQDVPIAVTAFNAADIRNAGINRPSAFIALTPNVNVNDVQGTGISFLTVRGIAQVRNSEQPVAVVIDGVPQISSYQFNQELFDITQIEVLKGPQGALYGNNSIGGAITVTTAEPGDMFGGYVQAGAGNGGLQRAQANLGGPISADGRWRAQISGFWSDFDGLIKNQYLNEWANPLHSWGGRLRVIGQVSDDLRLDFQASDGYEEGGVNYIYQPLYGVNDAANASLPITSNNHGVSQRDNSQAALKLDWQRPWGTLTSISAWSRVTDFTAGDQFPYSRGSTINPLPGWEGLDGTQAQYVHIKGISQELRLTSRSDQRLRWIAGLYAQVVDRYISSTTGEDLEQGLGQVRLVPNPPGSNSPTTAFLADVNANDTWAVFGQLAVDVTPKLEAALAMRYDYAKREQTNAAPPEFSANSGQVREASFSAFQPKLSLTWKPHARLTGFSSIGRGFNSGGFNQTGVGAILDSVGISGVDDLYAKEIADSYEIGIKSRPLDWLELNASAFYTDLENQHYFVFIGEVTAQVIAPIDKTRLQGIELELKAAPTRNLTLFGSYGYTDSEIRKNSVDASAVGNRSPYVPRSTVNLGAQYKAEFSEAVDSIFRVDYRRMGEQYWDTMNSTARPAVGLIDARVIVQPVSGAWSLTFWGRNLGDKQYLAGWVLGGFADPSLPRTYGADFRFNF